MDVAGMFLFFLHRLPLGVCLTCMIRIQPIGLVERIQAIAQNMSDMAVRVEQILQRTMASNRGMILKHTHNFRIPIIAIALQMNPSLSVSNPSNLETTSLLCPHKPGCQTQIQDNT